MKFGTGLMNVSLVFQLTIEIINATIKAVPCENFIWKGTGVRNDLIGNPVKAGAVPPL